MLLFGYGAHLTLDLSLRLSMVHCSQWNKRRCARR